MSTIVVAERPIPSQWRGWWRCWLTVWVPTTATIVQMTITISELLTMSCWWKHWSKERHGCVLKKENHRLIIECRLVFLEHNEENDRTDFFHHSSRCDGSIGTLSTDNWLREFANKPQWSVICVEMAIRSVKVDLSMSNELKRTKDHRMNYFEDQWASCSLATSHRPIWFVRWGKRCSPLKERGNQTEKMSELEMVFFILSIARYFFLWPVH